jgi:hypothetical protein
MTRLTFTGVRNGREISIIWHDGELSGDELTVGWIKYYAAAMDGHALGPVGGPYVRHEHLQNPYVAAEIIRSVFPGKVEMEGELPLREVPAGAIE